MDSSSSLSYAVLAANFLLFVVGVLVANATDGGRKFGAPVHSDSINLQPLIFVTGGTAFVAMLWLGGAALSVGGVRALAELAASESIAARDALRTASFPGGRLVAYGFIGIATLSSAYVVRVQSRKQRNLLAFIIGISLIYLAIMPLLVSGRITFFVACIGSYVAAALSARRLPSFHLLILGLILLATVWAAKQYLTLGGSAQAQSESVSSQAIEGFLFYAYNDVLNALNAPELLGDARTYGWYSIRFFFFMTFTDRMLLAYVADSVASINTWLTAGEAPLLMAPFVDFGYLGGLILIAFGYVSQKCYKRALRDPQSAAIYGMILSGLLMSAHSAFITSQEVVYSILLVYMVSRLCERTLSRQRSRAIRPPAKRVFSRPSQAAKHAQLGESRYSSPNS